MGGGVRFALRLIASSVSFFVCAMISLFALTPLVSSRIIALSVR